MFLVWFLFAPCLFFSFVFDSALLWLLFGSVNIPPIPVAPPWISGITSSGPCSPLLQGSLLPQQFFLVICLVSFALTFLGRPTGAQWVYPSPNSAIFEPIPTFTLSLLFISFLTCFSCLSPSTFLLFPFSFFPEKPVFPIFLYFQSIYTISHLFVFSNIPLLFLCLCFSLFRLLPFPYLLLYFPFFFCSIIFNIQGVPDQGAPFKS